MTRLRKRAMDSKAISAILASAILAAAPVIFGITLPQADAAQIACLATPAGAKVSLGGAINNQFVVAKATLMCIEADASGATPTVTPTQYTDPDKGDCTKVEIDPHATTVEIKIVDGNGNVLGQALVGPTPDLAPIPQEACVLIET